MNVSQNLIMQPSKGLHNQVVKIVVPQCAACLYCSWTCVFYGRRLCYPCACLFYNILCSPGRICSTTVEQYVLPTMCTVHVTQQPALPLNMSIPQSTAGCATPDHVWSTAACCPSMCLLKSIFQQVMSYCTLSLDSGHCFFSRFRGKNKYLQMKNKFWHYEIF